MNKEVRKASTKKSPASKTTTKKATPKKKVQAKGAKPKKAAAPAKKAAGKTVRTKKPASPEQLHTMVAEAAYYRAEQRQFAPGEEVDDWLWAERQIKKRRR